MAEVERLEDRTLLSGADLLEPNNTFETATQVGVVTGHGVVDDGSLSIHESGDEDWFAVELTAETGPGHFVAIEFDHADGDLDLELYDSVGDLVAGSYGLGDVEEIAEAGLAAGEYVMRVYGFDGADNPKYVVSYNLPTGDGDFAEPNDSLSAADPLGEIEGFAFYEELSIHEADNDDWFQFEMTAEGDWVHFAAIHFDHDEGDLDFALYDAGGHEIDFSASTDDFEIIWLEGLSAGTYYLEVYGFAGAENPDYELVIEAPHDSEHGDGSFEADLAEPNETIETAHDLGLLSGISETGPWSIHEVGDEDWYRFETSAAGTHWTGAAIHFWHEEGDLDLELYDAAGVLIATADGIDDMEWVEMGGLPAGEYFLHVAGFDGATNPDYWLVVMAPEPLEADFAEPNDSLEDAYDLRTIVGFEMLDGLSIDVAGDVDWFHFETVAESTDWHNVAIAFSPELGDLDLGLYDSTGELIESSEGIEGFELVSLKGLPAGDYYAAVWGFEDETNPFYVLEVMAPEEHGEGGGHAELDFAEPNDSAENAYDLRTLEHDSFWDDLSIHEAGNEDWFRFTTVAAGTEHNMVGIDFDHELGDLDLSLFDSEGTLLAVSESVWDFEHISLDGLPAGTYQLQVVGFDNAVHPDYVLGIVAPRPLLPDHAEANNTPETAHDLREVSGFETWDGFSIHDALDEDWFAFELLAEASWAHSVGIDFWHVTGDLDLSLYDEAGTLIDSSVGYDDSEEISLNGLSAGHYTVQVTGFEGATMPAYTLWLEAPYEHEDDDEGEHHFEADWAEPNDELLSATDLRVVQGGETWDGFSIHSATDSDWFRFEILAEGNVHHYVAIEFEHAEGDLELALLDHEGHLLEESTGVTDYEEISLAGWPAGVYHLQVTGFEGAINPEYQLMIEAADYDDEDEHGGHFPADAHEPNDSAEDASDLRTVEGRQTISDLSIHSDDDVDVFQFTIARAGTEGHQVRIEFEHDLGDLDLVLYDELGDLGHSTSVENFEEISLAGLDAGTYWVEIFGYSGQTNPWYSLTIDAPVDKDPDPDRLESNDTLAEATLVRSDTATGTLAGAESIAGLSIHAETDVDVFEFTTVGVGTAAHGVAISYRDGDGDLVLELLDAAGDVLERADGRGGHAALSLEGLQPQTFFARISGNEGVTNAYDLEFDTPVPAGESQSDAWTVMVYITASNLESFAHADVNEMEQAVGSLSGSVNLAVLWDQSSAGSTYASGGGSQEAWGTTGRAFLKPDDDLAVVATEFELLGELNTGHPDTLGDFIDWAVAEAPAEHYALILWDHGSGLQGFNYDDLDGTGSDHLTTPDLVDVLSHESRPFIDVISFDACLMAMVEVGYSLANLTGVFVASQEVVGAEGHDYRTLFAALEHEPESVSAAGLATGFIESYEEQYEGSFWGWDTQSAISTDGYALLLDALAVFADAGINGTADDLDALRDARDEAITYDISFLRDLGSFVESVADNDDASVTLRDAAAGVEHAIDGMVLARSEDGRESSGISIFLPDSATSAGSWYTTPYAGFNDTTGWADLIDTMGGSGSGGSGSGSGRSVSGPDWGEQNNVAAGAYDLNTLVGDGHAYSGLNLHTSDDVDWFRLTTSSTGTAGDLVTVTPGVAATEAVRLTLFDSAGTSQLEISDNGPGPQQVTLDGLVAGTYLLRIDTPLATSVTGYDLAIDAPDGDASSDWAGDNSTQLKAFPLGTIGSSTVFSGLGVAAGADDWFTFDTPRRVGSALYSLDVAVPQGSPLTVTIRDAGGATIDTATGDGTLSLEYIASGGGEQLTLLVNAAAATTAYSLHFEPVTATISVDLDASGNLVVTDTSGVGQNDHVLITTDGTTAVIQTPLHVASATVGTATGPHTVEVSLAEITGEIRVVSGDGADLLDATGSAHRVRLLGGSGGDTLLGGSADDVLNGGGGNDSLSGGPGGDRLFGGRGRDSLEGDGQRDYLSGQGGEDTLRGGDDHDTLDGGGSNDILHGNAGHDRLNGDDGHDRLNGGSGNDTAYGGDGNDVLRGGSGRDWLNGGAGGDRQYGQGSPDTLQGGAGNDLLDGGTGSDEVYASANINFTLTTDTLTGRGVDVLQSIDRGRLIGGIGHNTLDASAFHGSVVLFGGDGNDLLRGGQAIDRLVAGSGNDTLEGNGGNDRLFGGHGLDLLDGGAGDDFLRGQNDADHLIGGDGHDTLNGEGGNDRLYGGPGDDVLRGGSGDDKVAGQEGTDRVYGQAGNDELCGTLDDLVVGSAAEINHCLTVFDDWAEQLP